MGAALFYTTSEGKSPKEAFNNAVMDAIAEFGNEGYTGTIAEKDDYIMIPLPEGKDPIEYAKELIGNRDPRVDDKWGPAGCIKIPDKENTYLFFGWASF